MPAELGECRRRSRTPWVCMWSHLRARIATHERNVDRLIRPWHAPRSTAANAVARTAPVTSRMDNANR
ncbi:hypothetical protein EIQ06_12705 [Xanthomonas campestris pv. campestris]|nr:hypothetical protein AEA00_07180 [Xanthomonas campestris pv. campestris]PJR21244.1 hypothetical protein ASJ34_03585 [Xanthomonas campestris pv. campestris]QCX68884.1 hypothetical protein DFG55_22985 [Xanthomonas campestris pv. campestris]QCX70617.1 hypothetical protein DFG54_07430 [Xanthomonas campestris pv. campestris]RFF51980.1 hypothetical protein D0A42_02955 [Xanthomonas campestris pv. campestris]